MRLGCQDDWECWDRYGFIAVHIPITKSERWRPEQHGGTANGGINTDPAANTITFNVTAVNDAPSLDDTKTPVLARWQ